VDAFSIFAVLRRKNLEFVMGCGETRNKQGISKSQKGKQGAFCILTKLLKIHLHHGIPHKPFLPLHVLFLRVTRQKE
jgi:hypothetical protein